MFFLKTEKRAMMKSEDTDKKRLLVISNGETEDTVGINITTSLSVHFCVEAAPLVGIGTIYRKHGIPVCVPTRNLPSRGFCWGSPKIMINDVTSGLLGVCTV